jgi:glycosyltransferase involved in cell wall biosynthesis
MKILTNVQTANLAGISRVFFAFTDYLRSQSRESVEIVGVELDKEIKDGIRQENISDQVRVLKLADNYPQIGRLLNEGMAEVGMIRKSYIRLIRKLAEIISEESPDLIWLNGTYYVPWCLFEAAKRFNVPILLHYHGILTKEVEHWLEERRMVMEEMERSFDNDRLFYIFPSKVAKSTVENEVFGHEIAKSALLPNPIPDYFYEVNGNKRKRTIAMIARWNRIKNPNLTRRMAYYNTIKGNGWDFEIVTDQKSAERHFNCMAPLAKFREPMSGEKLAKFYADTGVVISPSYFETYGNVAQEAVASGTPALVSSRMGVKEVFNKVGLKNWVIDINWPVDKIYKRVVEAGKAGVMPEVREKMKEFSNEAVSKRLMGIFKSA